MLARNYLVIKLPLGDNMAFGEEAAHLCAQHGEAALFGQALFPNRRDQLHSGVGEIKVMDDLGNSVRDGQVLEKAAQVPGERMLAFTGFSGKVLDVHHLQQLRSTSDGTYIFYLCPIPLHLNTVNQLDAEALRDWLFQRPGGGSLGRPAPSSWHACCHSLPSAGV